MKIAYVKKKFHSKTLAIIDKADEIINEYLELGYSLTLRQLYYQFVARDLIPNTEKSYNNLGNIINDARMCGLLDWDAIEDRTRNIRQIQTWDSPNEIVQAAVESYRIDKWNDQDYRLEVWIEKDALLGVITNICEQLEVSYFSCRGYNSQSEMWRAGQRIQRYLKMGKTPVVIHLGDHDPSGIDMTRDIIDRLQIFLGEHIPVKRIALNIDQVEHYSPPPNPAKITDTRFRTYVMEFGKDSWELDALEPGVIVELIQNAVTAHMDKERWKTATEKENEERKLLQSMAQNLTKTNFRKGDV